MVSLIRTSRALIPPKGAFWRERPEWYRTTVLHPGLLPSGISVPVFTGEAGPPCTLHYTVEIAYSFKAAEEQLYCCSHISWVLTPNQILKVL